MLRWIFRISSAVMVIWFSLAHADLYSSCVKGYNFGNISQENFNLYMVNRTCYENCHDSCTAAFGVLDVNAQQLNNDVIERCQSFCQSNLSFYSAYRLASGALNKASNSPPSACASTSVNQRIYRLYTPFSANDVVQISLNHSSAAPNKVYGCGKDTIKIKPIFRSYAEADWGSSTNSANQIYWFTSINNNLISSSNNNAVITGWPNNHSAPTDHYCIFGGSGYNDISTYHLWNPASSNITYTASSFSGGYLPMQPLLYSDASNTSSSYRNTNDMINWYKQKNGPCKFSVRNPNYTDTGLYVQKGDELSISWNGDYTLYNQLPANSFAYELITRHDQACTDSPDPYCDNSCEGKPPLLLGCMTSNLGWTCSGCPPHPVSCSVNPGYSSYTCNEVGTTPIANGSIGGTLFRMTVPQLLTCERNLSINSASAFTALDRTGSGDAGGLAIYANSISSTDTATAIKACRAMRMLASSLDIGIGINNTVANYYSYFSGEYGRQNAICVKGGSPDTNTISDSTTSALFDIDWNENYDDNIYGAGALIDTLISRGSFSDHTSYDNNLGLMGRVADDALATCISGYYNTNHTIPISGCINATNNMLSNTPNANCYYLNYPSNYQDYSTYTYSGTLNSSSSSSSYRQNLGVRVIDRTTAASQGAINSADYADNTGGMDVTIKWGGCPHTGNNIQYYIAPCVINSTLLELPYVSSINTTLTLPTGVNVTNRMDLTPTTSLSYDVNDAVVNTLYSIPWTTIGVATNGLMAPITMSASVGSSGTCERYNQIVGNNLYLYVRIGWDDISGQQNINNLNNLYHNPGNFYGYYALSAEKQQAVSGSGSSPYVISTLVGSSSDQVSNSGGLLQNLIDFIRNTILGTGLNKYTDGIFYSIYRNVTNDTDYISIVRTMLVLYVAIAGASYTIGLSQFSSHDAIVRLLKIAFILAFISDKSWWIFSQYLLPITIEGLDGLCAAVGTPGYTTVGATSNGVTQVMSIVTKPLAMIWGSNVFWKKAISLIVSGMSGPFVFIIIILALLFYTMGMLKVVLIYLFAVLSLAFLMFLAPIVIPMSLFEGTKQYFDNWWKMILSFMMQPVLMFCAVAVMGYLTFAALMVTLNYTVCDFCYVTLEFFGIKSCILYLPRNIQSMHAPSSVHGLLFDDIIQGGCILLLFSYCMMEMPGAVASLGGKLVMGVGPTADKGATAVAKHMKDSAGSMLNVQNIKSNVQNVRDFGRGMKIGAKSLSNKMGVVKRDVGNKWASGTPKAVAKPPSTKK